MVVRKPVLYLVFSGKEHVEGCGRCSGVNPVWLCLVLEGLEQCQPNPNDKTTLEVNNSRPGKGKQHASRRGGMHVEEMWQHML